jgi:hypothetical protein
MKINTNEFAKFQHLYEGGKGGGHFEVECTKVAAVFFFGR